MKSLTGIEFRNELEKVLNTAQGEVCSIKLVKEDDGTFDIRIWDERENESREDLEEGHFVLYDVAETRLKEIIEENSEIAFIRTKDENIN